jgi:putative tryptophan/tyrosine transport system substrate-binding protein
VERVVAVPRALWGFGRGGWLGEFGLMSFGVVPDDLFRDCARIVAEILNGANPANIPISQPTKYELGLNPKTAKELGIAMPPSLLVQADKVIE